MNTGDSAPGAERKDGKLDVEASKFGLRVPNLDSGELPWGYGENRITAMVRDPDSAYLYWEITDEGIADARSRLGAHGGGAWCNLRVYDVTGRDFDGTNAVSYFDIGIDRADREYFLMIRRPSSTMVVEVGMKSDEGFFQPIARSGRAAFPRNGPSPDASLEWMTVGSYDVHPTAAPYRSRYQGPPPELPVRQGGGYVDAWRHAYAPTGEAAPPANEGASMIHAEGHRTIESTVHVERWWQGDAWRAEWRGGLRFTQWLQRLDEGGEGWHEGPIPFLLDPMDPERVAIEFFSESPTPISVEGGEFTVFGPWRVTVRDVGGAVERRVLATWTIHRVVVTTPMIERWGHVVERRLIGQHEREQVIAGASEQQRLLERGASELWRLGASERVWLGASEWWLGGASETLWLGASQWAFAGASARLQTGASERLGASERWRLGASEKWRLGASERWYLGGSERPHLGASEGPGGSTGWPGASPGTSPGGGVSSERWAARPEEA